nr:MAG TPA: hypothetical protein [Caudoviricetes sp.]
MRTFYIQFKLLYGHTVNSTLCLRKRSSYG